MSGLKLILILLAAGVALAVGGWAMAQYGGRSASADATDESPPADLAGSNPLRGLAGAGAWLNTPPLRAEDLRGKVVLVNVWTYSCINSSRALPYVRAWARKYEKDGLVVIGVHAPEFAFEKDIANVRPATTAAGVTYPVVLDNDFRIWGAFKNNAWPAFYFIGADGRVRQRMLGEGNYDKAERLLQNLLAEAKGAPVTDTIADLAGEGPQAAADWQDLASPETYLGYARTDGFASPGGIRKDVAAAYALPSALPLNQWALEGNWAAGDEYATLQRAPGRIAYRFHARDVHLILGPPAPGRTIRFRVTIDGQAPGTGHGVDVDAAGLGIVREPRMYQLIRQPRPIRDRTITIEFLDAGVRAYDFTFG